TAKASFAGVDTATKGSWRGGLFGTEGAFISNLPSKLSSYAQVSVSDSAQWVWSPWTPDPRALQYPEDARKRMASCWYGGAFTINLAFTDARTHRVSLYLCDWDSTSRAERIEILDAVTGAILSTQNFANFNAGQY